MEPIAPVHAYHAPAFVRVSRVRVLAPAEELDEKQEHTGNSAAILAEEALDTSRALLLSWARQVQSPGTSATCRR